MLTVGEKFPKFSCKACVGIEKDPIVDISNESHQGKWAIYFFYPKDFTFVCPTEIVEFGKQCKEFKDRDAIVYGGSTDNEYSHLAWRKEHEELRGLPYPLLAAQKLAKELGVLDQAENVCYRATFIVDPDGIIQWLCVNNHNVGRSVNEVLRVLDAIQSDELCPCNWKKGDAYVKV